MADTFRETLDDIARHRGILRDDLSAAENLRIDQAIFLVKTVMPPGLVWIDLGGGGEREHYGLLGGILRRTNLPVEGSDANANARRGFEAEALLLVRAIQDQSRRKLEQYKKVLLQTAELTRDETQAEAAEPRGIACITHDLLPELDELNREVLRASQARGAEDRLAQIIQRQAGEIAGRLGERFREAAVPGAEKLFGAIARGDTEAGVNLLENWGRWQRYLSEELITNRMLEAVTDCLVGIESTSRFDYYRPATRRPSIVGVGGVTPAFEGEATFSLDGDFNLHINLFTVRLTTAVPSGSGLVKAGGVRDEAAIKTLLGGGAFALALEAFAEQHTKLASLYDTLASSPGQTEEIRARLKARAEHHRGVTNEISPGTEVGEETVHQLETLGKEVRRLREEAALVGTEIDAQATHVAIEIRARLDTGSPRVRLEHGYEIRTLTEPTEPEPAPRGLRRLPILGTLMKKPERRAPQQCRVIVDTNHGAEPVEPVPWLGLDRSVAHRFVSRSAQMLSQMQGRTPVGVG